MSEQQLTSTNLEPNTNPSHYGKVAVMFGGNSAEREVSLNSGKAVLCGLLDMGIDAHAFDPAEQPLTQLLSEKYEHVLIMLHGRGGEDGSLQGALQQLNLPYSGTGVLGSALCMDKIRSKQVWQSLGLPTANYKIADKRSFDAGSCGAIMADLGNEVMVKPAQEGSSIGMAKVNSALQLEIAIQDAFKYDDKVLIEQFIHGSEYTVSILNGKALPSISMSTPRVFYDYAAKYQADSTVYSCPSGLTDTLETMLGELALEAFDALAGSGWGRVDFMQDKLGRFYLLEANTVPGMTEKSLLPMAAKKAGLSFAELSLSVLATADVVR
ncbi:D-alanine--D-alanine ligase [Paraglaciecola sp. MB-3u-78]|uniref:D-alanine--D-alanine ligase n=1 Tax=Paraglaciecola sp. MB-3u-78 TaxID=2058332 RepID=UPI000C34DF98|nr:D-alanine--D-alanine ligase [Paraglaciecola sp. MB-3u-78]PKG93340.1 D-alanine--D-alanine ligase [Paraglaciecola sp. MB-3u-78]